MDESYCSEQEDEEHQEWQPDPIDADPGTLEEMGCIWFPDPIDAGPGMLEEMGCIWFPDP